MPKPKDVHRGLFQCYNFISPNEYSEKTIGPLAFLLRQFLGEINFSDIFNEAVRLIQQKKPVDFVKLLDETRKRLPKNDASTGKCLMINGLITYIQEDEERFLTALSDILTEMKARMTDNQLNQMIRYPEDFRQREKDYYRRRDIQNMRHLFYCSPTEVEAPNLIYLQNRTSAHLSYITERQNFRNIGLDEIEKILSTSFMIIDQPHVGVNPVSVYTRYGSKYTSKVSVIIVSLLYDFMQSHPNMIELYDIRPILLPESKFYKLNKSQKLSWKTCQLQISPDEPPRTIQYAELTSITIKQRTSTNKKQIHFDDKLHSLTFSIQLHLNLPEHKISKTYQIPLQSLPFAISSHNNHISYLSTKVMLAEIQRFSQLVDVKVISSFVLRYFIHRTGVEPKQDLRTYLEEELTRAKAEKKNCQSLEDIYIDFLAQFVHQVEFMAKHPILAMFYADGLFFGPCNSGRAAQIMIKSADVHSPIVGLRFNSITTNYQLTTSTISSSKSMKMPTPFVRVDIYNPRTNIFQKCTFDSSILTTDICKFVCTSVAEKASFIRILFNSDDGINGKTYKDFTKYNHARLYEICKTDPNYKHLTDLLRDIEDNSGNTFVNGDQTAHSFKISRPTLPTFMSTNSDENGYDGTDGCSFIFTPCNPSSTNEASLHNDFSLSFPQPLQFYNNEDLIRHVLSNSDLCATIFSQFCNLQVSPITESVQQQQSQILSSNQQQPQIPYSNQQQLQMSYSNQQQPQIPYSNQQQPQMSYSNQQQPQIPYSNQQQPQMSYSNQQQPQLSYASQQQQFYPQQQLSTCMVHNQPIDPNQYQLVSAFPSNDIHTFPQQHQTQIQNFQITDNVLALSNPSFDQLLSTDQISSDTMNTNDYDWSNSPFPSRNNQ